MPAKNRRTGAGRIIFRRREALLRGSPLRGQTGAALMIIGMVSPYEMGLGLPIIVKAAGWAGGIMPTWYPAVASKVW